MKPCDAQQFEDWCWCPKSGTTRHNPQDRFSQSSVNAELSEEAPDPHSVPFVEAPSGDVEREGLSGMTAEVSDRASGTR